MEAAEDWDRHNRSGAVCRAMERRVLVQGKMSSHAVVERDVAMPM